VGDRKKDAEYIILIGIFSEKQIYMGNRIEDLQIKRIPGKEAVEMGGGCLRCKCVTLGIVLADKQNTYRLRNSNQPY
jgi:hypothetical protein